MITIIRLYFSVDTLQWSCPEVTGMIPGARDGHSACIINHCMFVFGGFEEDIDRFSQDVHALDFRTMHWSYIITQVRLHTCACY